MACMFNKGENCIAAGRLFVEASIHDEFVHRVVSGKQNDRVCIIAVLECSGENTRPATNVVQVQVLPGIKQVGCGINTIMWVEVVLVSRGSRGTLVYPSCQNKHSGKYVLQYMFINRQRHLVDLIIIFSSGNCQMSPPLKKGSLLLYLAALFASGSLGLNNSQVTDIHKISYL